MVRCDAVKKAAGCAACGVNGKAHTTVQHHDGEEFWKVTTFLIAFIPYTTAFQYLPQ